jgi:hypothetical protein
MTMTSEPVFAPARLALLLQHFAEINDDRESWRVAYPLKEVLLLVTCATIASCDDFEAIVSWGEHHLAFLRRFSDFHSRAPSSPAVLRPSSLRCGPKSMISSPSTVRRPGAP